MPIEKEGTSNTNSLPLDILMDLKGSDNTEVLNGLKEDIKEQEEKSNITDTQMINSFYTSSNALKKTYKPSCK